MILTIKEFRSMRHVLGRVVCTSGGFDPLHPGHVDCIRESKSYGDILVVAVNSDEFLTRKKGKPFMSLPDRCEIIDSLRWVDYTIPFEATDPSDMTVSELLFHLHPEVFTKGGDRVSRETIPEWDICEVLNIALVTGVGGNKRNSSSELLHTWKQS